MIGAIDIVIKTEPLFPRTSGKEKSDWKNTAHLQMPNEHTGKARNSVRERDTGEMKVPVLNPEPYSGSM